MLAKVMAQSQQEYLDSLKKQKKETTNASDKANASNSESNSPLQSTSSSNS
jgi:hypothetical protein